MRAGETAPEVIDGALPSRAADLYGLGATVIHLLAGIEPSLLPRERLKIDFRAQLRKDGAPLSETWLYRWTA